MSELPTNHYESMERLPSEEEVVQVFQQICAGKEMYESSRRERQGSLCLLEMMLTELNESGNHVLLSYEVNRRGEATIDVAFFDPQKGFDYRPGMGYDPQDIVTSYNLGRFIDGVWHQENTI